MKVFFITLGFIFLIPQNLSRIEFQSGWTLWKSRGLQITFRKNESCLQIDGKKIKCPWKRSRLFITHWDPQHVSSFPPKGVSCIFNTQQIPEHFRAWEEIPLCQIDSQIHTFYPGKNTWDPNTSTHAISYQNILILSDLPWSEIEKSIHSMHKPWDWVVLPQSGKMTKRSPSILSRLNPKWGFLINDGFVIPKNQKDALKGKIFLRISDWGNLHFPTSL